MVGHDLTGQTLLDAFAGSGIMAIEAWSRGATVTAVERDRRAFADLRARVAELDATMELVRADLRHALDGRGPFDLVFADPPYAEDPGPWIAVLAPITSGTLWFEADRQTRVPDELAGLRLHRTRTFGSTALHAYAPEHP
jgi:16S rRNA (guanine966-N2)-methyltransferase